MVSPQAKREAVSMLMTERDFGVTRACGLLQISRSLYRYRSRRAGCADLRERIQQIAETKRRYGYRRIYIRLRREGWPVNRKHVYRLYREAGLAVRRRKRKRIGLVERKPLPKPLMANQSWSMDFVSDGLADGRRIRCLNIVDDCTRECLAIEVDTSLTGARVKAVLQRLADTRGLPDPSRWIMVRSSKARCSTAGPTRPACSCRSSGPASRTRTPTSKASMASSGTSV
jgi:putative transposase